MTPELKADFDYIMDTFGGAENGRFIKFLYTLRFLDEKRTEGDEAAALVLDVVTKFKRLIEAAQKG